MAAAKTPQDRRPKAKAVAAEAGAEAKFTFEHEGKTYELATGADAAGQVSGKLISDAIMNDDDVSEMCLAFATLEADNPDEAVLGAVFEQPYIEMMTILGDWMQIVQGATPGK